MLLGQPMYENQDLCCTSGWAGWLGWLSGRTAITVSEIAGQHCTAEAGRIGAA